MDLPELTGDPAQTAKPELSPNPEQEQEAPKYFGWRPLGFLISREVSTLALVALVLSISTLAFQLKSCAEGAKVNLVSPDLVYIIKDASGFFKDRPRVRFAATMTYVNKAAKDFAGVIEKEGMAFDVNGRTYRHYWDETGEMSGEVGNFEWEGKLSQPFSVGGGETVSHLSYFTPWPVPCDAGARDCDVDSMVKEHAYWDEFVAYLKNLTDNGLYQYRFQFFGLMADEESVEADCVIQLTRKIVLEAIEKYEQYSPTCYPR